ncbi:MAG: SRPBCC family protein, partial [Gammaproteobacteria bacterium]|nr:SRPBCC family protein [Gammaproteobacteria bacterium]
EKASASRSGTRYNVELVLVADIPESFAREILEDPDRVVKVNSELLEAEHLYSGEPGVRRFRDHTRACLLFFCVDYQNTLSMRILENGDIQLIVDPAHSAFTYGVFTWRTEMIDADHTRLTFHSESTPSFWVPATGLLESRMRHGVREMVRKMECEYRQDALCIDPETLDSTLLDE